MGLGVDGGWKMGRGSGMKGDGAWIVVDEKRAFLGG